MKKEEEDLIHAYLDDRLSGGDFWKLQDLLRTSKEARSLLLDCGTIDSKLDGLSQINTPIEGRLVVPSFWNPASRVFAVALVILLLGLFPYFFVEESEPIAQIISSENASWESSLPTSVGSNLTPGIMNLRSGLATLKMASGAEVIIEGPALLELLSPMTVKLFSGVGVVQVPESAIGFIVETPDGYAVDYGTRFSVSVNHQQQSSIFEVLNGEIAVHHPQSGSEIRLKDRQGVEIKKGNLSTANELGVETNLPRQSSPQRIFAQANSTSFIRNNHRDLYLSDELLLVKKSDFHPPFDRRILIEFDLDQFNLKQSQKVRLGLNLVPGSGIRSHLPEENRFIVYGVEETWSAGVLWEEAPTLEQAKRLGEFSIPRSKKEGNYGIQTPELAEFVKSGNNKFLIIRQTSELESSGLVHAFAGPAHPYSAPPVLEFIND